MKTTVITLSPQENSKTNNEPTKPAVKQNSVLEKWCYNKYGCPFNNKVAAQRGANGLPAMGDKQTSTVSSKKPPKFNQVTIPCTQEVVSFCEFCYESFQHNEKCDYCYQVYLNSADDGEVDGQLWISCDNEKCQKWNHPDCEIKHGKDPEYKAAA